MTSELKRQIAYREDSIQQSEAIRERPEACRFKEDAEPTRQECERRDEDREIETGVRGPGRVRPVDERTELIGRLKTWSGRAGCPPRPTRPRLRAVRVLRRTAAGTMRGLVAVSRTGVVLFSRRVAQR